MDELVQKNSKSPNIELVIMLAMVNHLRSHVLKCAAESVALAFSHLASVVLFHFTLTRPPEVTNFEHIILVYQQIFWL